ncbi:ArnT family glycosyltransferase [Haloplanus halophilus]|uniref:ArnT family glycosyltransferase n=1 Tax=Haloplanus halophilus TaxID=2949993 RepID=UPI00204153AE|nr:glycosyltransferase family 39 protein [Haloplanus sp. GDY1]
MGTRDWTRTVASVTDRLRARLDAFGEAFSAPVGVVLAVATVVVFYRLGERPLWWWDESFYANAALHAVEGGHWLIPHLAGFDTIHPSPFLEKPPLAIWLEALSIGAFGPTEFAVRVPSAAAAVATTVLVYAVGRRIRGRAAGLVAAAVFLTTPAVIVGTNAARFGATDTLHVLFGSLLVVLVWLHATGRRDVSPLLVGGVASALLLTKGFAAGAFLLALAPLPVRYRERFSPRFVGVATAVTAVAVGWWVVAAYLLQGGYFVEEIFLDPVWARIVGADTAAPGPGRETLLPVFEYPYLTKIQGTLRPWWFLFLAGAVVAAARPRPADGDETPGALDPRFLLWWALAAAAPFALFGTQPWYILPLYVPAALTVGWLVASAVDGHRPAAAGVVAGTVLVALAGDDGRLYGLGGDGGFVLDPALPSDPTAVIAVAIVCVGGWLLTATPFGGGEVSLPGALSLDVEAFGRALTVGVVLALVAAALVGTPSVYAAGNADEPTDTAFHRLGETTADVVPAGERVYVQPNAAALWFYASYEFYADRPMREVPVERLRSDPRVRYALLTTAGVPLVTERDPTVLARSDHLGIVLVELGPPPET